MNCAQLPQQSRAVLLDVQPVSVPRSAHVSVVPGNAPGVSPNGHVPVSPSKTTHSHAAWYNNKIHSDAIVVATQKKNNNKQDISYS